VEALLAYASPSAADTARSGFLHSPLVRPAGQAAAAEPLPAIPGYEIEGVLGRGGMGVVYRARDLALQRTVALKLILAGGQAGAPERQRFQAEAEAVARLQHPNVVQIHAVGEHGGVPYCALELVEGGSLAHRLAAGSLPAAEAAGLVEALAGAVGLAHRRHVVHRDLKPANVLLASDGTPKVSDFGLARRLDVEGHPTQTGAVLGTPSYMAPEQARGEAAGPAADVYALGAVLYECLTGRPPFKGASAVETLDLVRRQEPVAPRWLSPQVPRDLETVCLKCLSKEPEQRYAGAEALADDLRRWQSGEPIAARPVGALGRAGKWARRNPAVARLLAAVAGSLLLGASAATFFALRATVKADLADQEARRADREARANQELAERERDARLDAQEKGQLAEQRAEEARAKGKLAEQRAEEARAKGKLAEQRAEEARFEAARAGNALHASQLRQALRARQDNDLGAAEGALAEVEAPFREALETRFLRQVCRRQMRTLPGGPANASISDLAVSDDGKRIFSAHGWLNGPGEVKAWDAETGREQFTFKGHSRGARCVALSGDGTRAVSGGNDQTVKVWDANTGKEQLTFKGHVARGGAPVTAVAISGDGKWVVSGSGRTVKVWDADTGKERLSFLAHPGRVSGVAIRRDGRQIVTAGGEDSKPGEVKVWDAETGAEKLSLRGHTAAVNRVALSGDGKCIVSGGQEGVVRAWDAETGQELFVLRVGPGPPQVVAVSGDGKRIVSGSIPGGIKVWDGRTGKEQLSFRGQGGAQSVAVSADGKRVVSGFRDGIKVWSPDTPPERLTLPSTARPVPRLITGVAVTPDGRRVVSGGGVGGTVGVVTIWDGDTGRERATRVTHTNLVKGVAISADGKCVVSGSLDRTVKVWDGDTGAERFTLRGHTGWVGSVAISRDGRRIFSGSADRTIKVWDAATGQELRTLPKHTGGVRRDPARVALFGGLEVLSLRGHYGQVRSLAVSGDGKWLVSGGLEGAILLWDTESGERKMTLEGHTNGVFSLAISRDDKWFVSAGQRELKIWDAETGRVKRALKGTAHSISISADGERIVTGGPAGLTFWDVETGLEKLTFAAHAGGVLSVALSDNGDIITGGRDAAAKVWDARTERKGLARKGGAGAAGGRAPPSGAGEGR
jgi:WD40 repeat protein